MTDSASRSGFEGFFVMVGNCINEDSGLAHVFATSGAENVHFLSLFFSMF
jgi:hypothetical protein